MPLREGPLPSVSQSVSQSVRVPAELFSGRQTKPHPSSSLCPSFSFAPGLSHHSLLILIPSCCTGIDTAGILCDNHPVRPRLALVVVLVVVLLVINNNTVFCKYFGTQSSLIKPLLKLQGLGSTHSLQNVPPSRLSGFGGPAEIADTTALGLRVFPPWHFMSSPGDKTAFQTSPPFQLIPPSLDLPLPPPTPPLLFTSLPVLSPPPNCSAPET